MESNNGGQSIGNINISDEVVSNIVGMATLEIDGVVGLSGGVTDGIADLLKKNEFNRGVEASINEGKVKINISIIVEFGMKIPDISWRIQQNVKRRIEEMTGLSVTAVNVLVRGVDVKKEDNNNEKSK